MNGIPTTFIVQGALWLLVVFSVVTWTLIVVKAIQSLRASARNRRYVSAFWAANSFHEAAALDGANSPVGELATTGFDALRRADESSAHDLEHSWSRHDLLERHLRQQIHNARRREEAGLAVLASIGSTAPFVGLLGTVWGIYHALGSIAASGQAQIENVAGPVGEALIMTAFGLVVAIPAVLAYNILGRLVRQLAEELDGFARDLHVFVCAQEA